jgi:hypothetical protein
LRGNAGTGITELKNVTSKGQVTIPPPGTETKARPAKTISNLLFYLNSPRAGRDLSGFHREADIAACDSTASDNASTHWIRILALRIAEISR